MLVVFLSCSSKLNFVVLLVETLGFSSSDVTEFDESSGNFYSICWVLVPGLSLP